MNNTSLLEKENYIEQEVETICFNYSENITVQKLLDAIAKIIADEYIIKAKQNPEIFLIMEAKI